MFLLVLVTIHVIANCRQTVTAPKLLPTVSSGKYDQQKILIDSIQKAEGKLHASPSVLQA